MRIAAMTHLRRGWACGAFALMLTALPAIAAPAIGRADPNCAEGFVWSVDLHQCVPAVPAVNGPGGPGGPSAPGGVGGPGGLGGPGGPSGPGP